MTTAATTALNRIADALEQIAMKPVVLDGSHMDRESTQAMLDEAYPPEERVWQFLINFPKDEPLYEETEAFRVRLREIAQALEDHECCEGWDATACRSGLHRPDTEPEEECLDVSTARRATTHFYGDGCPEPHGKPEEQLS